MSSLKLRVSIVQSNLHWENPQANRAHFSKILSPLANTTDLIVLPEMFTTGFSMNAQELSETQNGAYLCSGLLQHQNFFLVPL